VSKKPQKYPHKGFWGSFVVIAATVVVKNKTARKRFLRGIYVIKINKIKAVYVFICAGAFLSGLGSVSGPVSGQHFKIWHRDC